jgi:8-amino-7-oxononanoate synthase
MQQLASFLAKATTVPTNSNDNLIISEGVFSMDGDQAKIPELLHLAEKNQAWLYVDDAHSLGVVGQQGEGSSSYVKENTLHNKDNNKCIDIVMANFGKAIATNGAFVACEENVAEHLVNFSRHYIYSTAMSPAIAWATKASIALVKKEQWRRDKITELSELFISKLNPNIEVIPSQSSIHAIVIGSEIKTMEICQKLKEKGIWLTAIRPPTVLNNSSRLRVTICASHNSNNINYLAKCLNEVCL